MANQMIALQARAPQTAGLGGAIQQNAQMINMLAQQRAAERQAAQTQQKMALEAQLAEPQLAKAKSEAGSSRLKFVKDFMDTSAFGIANARNAQDALRIGEILKAEFNDAELNEAVDQTLASIPQDPAAFDDWRQDALMRTMEAAKQLEYMIPKAKSELTYGLRGEMQETRTGGISGQGVYPLQSYRLAAPKTGTVEVGEQTTVEPGGDSRAALDLRNAATGVRNNADYQVWLGMVAKADPQFAGQLRQMAPTYNPKIMQQIIMSADEALGGAATGGPDIPLVAGPRGGPYEPTGQQAYGKNPMQSPMPGSAIVPIPRIAAEKRAEAQASQDVQTATEQTKKLAGKKQVSTILGKMRDAYEQLEKAEAIPSEKRGTFSNVLDYLGSSTLGREAQKLVGTEESKYLSRIVNMRKALATAIKNATGMSAQEMNSNVELQLTLDTLTDPTQGIEAARMALADLEEIYGAPKAAAPAGQRRTPTRRANIDALLKKYGD